MTVVQLTKEDWYEKIKTMVPAWFWENEVVVKAWAYAVSKLAEQLQITLAAHVADTFILQAALDGGNGVLDSHGAERSIARLPSEVNPTYAVRVQNLFNQSDIPALEALVNEILVVGTALILDDYNPASAGYTLVPPAFTNGFSVIFEPQIHAPYTFASRSYFASRGAFCGTCISLPSIIALINQIVSDNKAQGTMYRLIELP